MKITQEYKDIRPIVKVIAAFVLRLRFTVWTRQQCLTEAEHWLEEIERG